MMMNTLHNINIERSVLSSILFNPVEYEGVSEVLTPEDFYLPAHKYIFEAMRECEREDLPIDEEFIKKKLVASKRFDEDAMLEILSTNPLPSTKAYIEEIKEKKIKRELIKLTGKIKEVVIEKDLPSNEVVDIVQQSIYEISSESSTNDFMYSSEAVDIAVGHIAKLKQLGGLSVVGLDTGYKKLNETTTGLCNGDLIILAARPGMGKTSLALNIASKNLSAGKGVVIYSLEMPVEQLINRILSIRTSISLLKIKTGQLDDDEWKRVLAASNQLGKEKLFIYLKKEASIQQIRSKLRKLKTKHPEIALCVIDYLQLMTSATSKDRHLEVSDMSRGLKLLAGELNIPIVALSQLNRALELRKDKRPMLSDLRESGSIEQDADIIMFVYREDVYRQEEEKEKKAKARSEGKEYVPTYIEKPEEEGEIIVGKNRNGPLGAVKVFFRKVCASFIDGGIPIEILYNEENISREQGTITIPYKD